MAPGLLPQELLSLSFLYPLDADGDHSLLSLYPASPLGTIRMNLLFFVSLPGCFVSPTLFPIFQMLFFNGFHIACFRFLRI